MNHLPLKASIECQDGTAGKLVDVVINPVSRQITYLVVEEKHGAHLKRLVPNTDEYVKYIRTDEIVLTINLADLARLEPFEITHFVQDDIAYGPEDAYILEPYTLPAHYEVVEERIPPGQLAMHRGTAVQATDGKVGTIDEFLVDPNDGHITHLVMRERHLLQKQELTLPITAVDRVEGGVVHLKLSKEQIEALPAIPTQRRMWKDAKVELMVLVYDDMNLAKEALKELKSWQKEHFIGSIRNSAVIVKDEAGEADFHEAKDMDKKRGTRFGLITGGLIGLVGGPAGMVVAAAAGAVTGRTAAKRIDVGLPDEYLAQIEKEMAPGSSALVAVVEHEWAGNVVDELEKFGGKVFQQALPDELVDRFTQENDESEAVDA